MIIRLLLFIFISFISINSFGQVLNETNARAELEKEAMMLIVLSKR